MNGSDLGDSVESNGSNRSGSVSRTWRCGGAGWGWLGGGMGWGESWAVVRLVRADD